jgi:Uncharacterized protein conserved in bacteria (DUF2062)
VKAAAAHLMGLWSSLSEELPLILAVGIVLGAFPVYGVPTLLCLIAARTLRLNPVALLAVNQISTPIQFALLVPFARLGWRIPLPPAAPLAWKLAALGLQAITGWCLVAAPAGILLYYGLSYLLRRGGHAMAPAAC